MTACRCLLRGSLAAGLCAVLCLFCWCAEAQSVVTAVPTAARYAGIGGSVTLTVRATLNGAPLPDRTISFSAPNSTFGFGQAATDRNGMASITIPAGPVARTFSVQATNVSVQPPPSVSFLITVGRADQQTETTNALRSFAALGRTGLDSANAQLSNVQNRLRDRRGGAGGISLYGASFNDGNHTLPGTTLQSLVSYLGGGDGTSTPQLDAFGRWGIFVNGQGSFGTKDTTSNETGYHAKTGGITAGADYRLSESFIVGAALGFLRTRSNFDAAIGQSKASGVSVSLFGTYYHKNGYYIDSIANIGWNGYDTDRNVSSGAVASASTRGNQGAISISSGYEINRGALAFGPYLRASYIRVRVNEFSESGADEFNVHSDAQNLSSLTTDLGLQASYAISTAWGVISPNARLEWEHQYRDNSRLLSGSLVADPLTQTFVVATDEPDRNYFNLALGVAAQFAHGRSAFISYETVLGRSRVTNHAITAGVRLEF
jgi:outer membrane lipase/esterase